ncbi:unnamed protein product [Cercopithifilaria johnstoni]|uniref:Uncharacterized protein n=1 Tax=Cercopithifilaria johnstoni TaxID=2874296 RepID=A0A8J2M334_9BILA|nr:unnamed protein product [Cercopithifilaria johnstoni]
MSLRHKTALVYSASSDLQVDPFSALFPLTVRLVVWSFPNWHQYVLDFTLFQCRELSLLFDSMVKKSKKHHKKVKKVKNKDVVVAQTLSLETQEVPTGDSIESKVEVQPVSELIILWQNSKIENISRMPGGNQNEAFTENEKLKNHWVLVSDYHCKGDEKFLKENYRGAYVDLLCAMKILSEHGNINDEFGRDMKMLRSCLTRCFECYNQLIEKDPSHAFWYKRRATLLRCECQNFISAYKALLDFVLFTALMNDHRLKLTKEEMSEIASCFHETENMAWSLEKEKIKTKKPFLTSDWINLWALCPCDDILLQDLLSIRNEDVNPQNKSTLVESAYKDALRQIARGYHSMAVDTLLGAYAQGQGIYRSEAFLLLSLIYSQLNGSEVHCYLDTFVDIWRIDQYTVPLPRRKKIFMRYISLSRAMSLTPFQNLDLSMFSPQEQAHFYTQMALTTILTLRILCGSAATRLALNELNLTKLEIIENSCDRAIKVDKKSWHARILREYTVMEIAQIDNAGKHSKCALVSFMDGIKRIQHQFKPEHHSFALWCLFSAHFINRDTDEAIKCGLELKKDLLYPGFVVAFLIKNEYTLRENIDTEDILNRIAVAEEGLEYDPENFRLHLNIATFYEYLNFKEEAYMSASLAAKYWPVHIIPGQLKPLIGNMVIMEAVMEAEKKLRNIKTFIEMEQELEKKSDTEPKASDSVSGTCEKEHPTSFNSETKIVDMLDPPDLSTDKKKNDILDPSKHGCAQKMGNQ